MVNNRPINKLNSDSINNREIRIHMADGVTEVLHPGENANCILVGPPGSGKTFSNIVPSILDNKDCSLVIDDKKGNLYKNYGAYLESQGYKVYVFDLVNFKGNMHYNFFEDLKTKEDIARLVTYMIPLGDNSGDRMWIDGARQILTAIIELGQVKYGKKLNLKNIVDLSNQIGGDNSKIDRITTEINYYKRKGFKIDTENTYMGLRNSAEVTWRSFVVSYRGELNKFCTPKLFQITDKSTVDFKTIGTEKTALFITNSDTNKVFAPVIQLMYNSIAQHLFHYADTECDELGNKLPYHVRFILDDFASGTRQEKFENMIANARSRNISYTLSIQSISQLKAIYKEMANTILDCIDYKVFFSTTDGDSAYVMSRYSSRPKTEIMSMGSEDVLVVRRCKATLFKQRIKVMNMPEFTQARLAKADKARRDEEISKAGMDAMMKGIMNAPWNLNSNLNSNTNSPNGFEKYA